MTFRIQTKKLFATYSQCSLKKQVVLDWFMTNFEVDKYIVAHEKHKDGGDHLHVYMELFVKCDIKNPRRCDIHGFHPKMESVRSPSKCQRYCKKENDYLSNMLFDVEARARDLAMVGKVEEALILIGNEAPKEIKFLDRWEKNLKRWARMFNSRAKPKHKFSSDKFRAPEELEAWDSTRECLVLTGSTGTGKTQFAKSLFKNPLIVRHIDKLKVFDPWRHDGIIFDDMSFAHWPRDSCISLCDVEEDSDINVKCGMITIPSGTPKVFTTNRPATKKFPIFNTLDPVFPNDPSGAIVRRLFIIETGELRNV